LASGTKVSVTEGNQTSGVTVLYVEVGDSPASYPTLTRGSLSLPPGFVLFA
jgi:hypothetical protein